MVVGPPGTGKTDVAVQVISNWYHHYPDQRILLITHSNQALNQLFEKIMALGKITRPFPIGCSTGVLYSPRHR